MSVYKQVKPSLSFATVLKIKKVVNHVNVHSSVKRSYNRGQQPKVLGSRKVVQYGKSCQYNEVARDSMCSSLQQGESHMGRDVRAHVKCKGKQSLL